MKLSLIFSAQNLRINALDDDDNVVKWVKMSRDQAVQMAALIDQVDEGASEQHEIDDDD